MPTRLTHAIRDERPVPGGRRIDLTFGPERAEERVPAVLLLPEPTGHPAPGAVLLHGFTSRKEQMAEMVGVGLLRQGVASLAIDLPLHGERITEGQGAAWGGGMWERAVDRSAFGNPLALAGAWRGAQREARHALGYLGARAEVDRERLAVVGYSMGSFLGVQVAADERAVRALVLAAGGDLPEGTPFARLVRTLADPLRAVRRFDGKPLLMVHGRRDPTVTAAQAQRLFDAAMEPKELRWYDAGHYLPPEAIDDAARWLVARLGGGAARAAG